MEVVWSDPAALTVREVHRQLNTTDRNSPVGNVRPSDDDNRELAYTTVMTVLDRLTKKGLLRRQRDGRAYRYRAVQRKDALVAELMHATLDDETADGAQDRTAALVAFVGKVTSEEAAAIRTALDRLEEGR